jgi:hypothetical protein
MTQDILYRPEDTGEIVFDEGDTRALPPRSPLPRPDVADTTKMVLPDRVFFTLPDASVALHSPDRPAPRPLPNPSGPPKPSIALGDAQPIAPWERVAGAEETAVVTLLGALGGEAVRLRRSVPYAMPEGHAWAGPKHRRPSLLRAVIGAMVSEFIGDKS